MCLAGKTGLMAYYGRKPTEATLVKMSEAQKGKRKGEDNPNYRWSNVSYRRIHDWAKETIEKPDVCPICGQKKQIDYCNKDHKYHRVVEDWFCACRKCHFKYDRENHLR